MAYMTLVIDGGVSVELLDASGAAELVGCRRRAIDQLICAGELPATRFGQSWVIYRSDVEAWAKANPVQFRSGPRVPTSARADLDALATIADHPGITVVGLADLRHEPRRTTLERLQRLEREGLINRRPGAPREAHKCHLTEAGRERYDSHTTASATQAGSA